MTKSPLLEALHRESLHHSDKTVGQKCVDKTFARS